MYYLKFILLFPCLFSINSCEVTEEKKAKLLSDFINYYNFRPNVGHRASDGFLRSVDEIDPITYQIEVSFIAKSEEGDGSKMMKCSAGVQDLDDKGIAILNNILDCQELHPSTEDPNHTFFTADVQTGRPPITLENEVQSDTSVTSGEQFIAIPRGQSSAPCIGCSSVVNPQAQGVQDLASLGVRHLDIHEPNVKHSLDSVMEVERQVQVINGVRYILTLSIIFDNCAELKTDSCMTTKTCKVSILVKPWMTLPNGGKYRAILSNNCTEQWLFGDDGEVLPDPTASQDPNKKDEHTSGDDEIQVKRHEDVQSQPNAEKTLTPDEIKALEEQILPLDPVHDSSKHKADTPTSENIEADKDHVIKVNTTQQYSENSLPPNESSKHEHGSSMLSEDKRKAIDEMLDFLKFSGYRPQNRPRPVDSVSRQKRSYDYDLQLLSLTEDYRDLKRSIENAKFIYEMAQATVDYLNEIDIEVKNRAVKNVLKAEEEEENEKHFVYLQVQVVIPCDTASCDRKQIQTKICNGVVDSTDKKSPQVLYTFCYADNKEVEMLDKAKEIEFDDPVLLRLCKEVLKKMEFDSKDTHAMEIKKIVSANTRVASGRLTKITMVVDYIDCSKSVPLVLRKKCSALQHLGSRICEVLVHERHWLKEKKITYTCTERPIDMIITKNKQHKNITVDDPKIAEILQDALQYLETQSSKKNKQQIINVSKISTQVLAGFLIEIEFIVGYTNCSNNGSTSQSSKCLLLQNEHLRSCKVQVWDRSWIIDGRQMEVACDEIDNHRSKRGIPGSVKEQNPDDPTYRQLAEESLQKYISNSGDKMPHILLRIEKVTTQVVAGSLTKIYFVAVPADNPQGEVKKCQSQIWERRWLNEKEVNVTCDIDNHRSKREIPGGVMEQDPDDPTYRQLAEESLQKYVSNSGDKMLHTLLRIEKVTTQVVAGSLTKIYFLAVPADNPQGEVKKCQSQIWERRWINKKEVNVICINAHHRSKRGIPGGVMEQDPDDPTYRQLAEESLQKYVSNSGDKMPHTLLRIEKVNTQVVAGSLTKIYFVAVPADNPQGEVKKCQSQIWERRWLNEKEVNVTCDIDNHRSKREIPGGVMEQDPDDPTYRQLAEESLQKYVSNSGDKMLHTLLRIEKVTTQVVAGSLTKIYFVAVPADNPQGKVKKCQSQIWERRWLNEKEVNVTCDIDNHRSKRGIPGGVMEQDPDDPTYRQLAEESLQKYVSNSGDKIPHTLLRIEKVTTQVVAGSLTKIYFVAVTADNPQGELKKCQSQIWERRWLNEKEVNVTCDIDNHRSKRGIPGGVMEQDPDDPTYRQLAEESLQKYVSNSGDKMPYTLLRIEKVTTQVVAGSLTKIYFVAVPADNLQGEVKKCQSQIWERRWLNEKEVNVTCDIDNHRSKRGVSGGVMEQDPDDPTYRQLAEESLQKYVSNSGDKMPHTLLRIEKVTTQVVEGSLTVIDFVAVPMDNSQDVIKKCHSTIWERPWLKEKEIAVTCEIDDHISKRELVGGGLELNENHTRKSITLDNLIEQDPSEPQYLQLANESLQKFLVDSCNKEPHKVAKVVKVTTQIVSGKLTRLEFIVLPMNTSKSDIFSCYAEVWERPWTDEKDIKITCDLFMYIEMPKISSYIQWANESLQKYLSDTRNHHPYKIVQIEQATLRGLLTKIIFVASSTEKLNDSLNCVSEIFNAPSLTVKEIHVICESDTSIDREKWDFMDKSNNNKHIYETNKKNVEEGDVKKPEFNLLALQSLRKFSKSIGTLHKLFAVSQVTKVSTSQDIVYKIKYNANPTECPFNVSNMRALTCQIISNTTLNCKATIWEHSELPEKIHVKCVMPEDYLDLLESDEEEKSPDTNNELTETEISQKVQESNAYVLAEEALEKYLSIIDAKNVYRIIAIHSHYEYLADEIVEFAISPTECLINHFKDSRDNCSFVQPRVIYNCKAKSKGRALFMTDNDIEVTCRKLHMSKEKINNRIKRQINNEHLDDADNEIDEDTMYYYAKSAISQINSSPQNSNMFKLVTIHAVKSSIQMKAIVVKMYLEVAETYCLRYQTDVNLENCEEMEGLNHRLCLARIYPSPSDELVIRHVHVVCDDDEKEFNALTGLHVFELLRLSIDELERKPETHFKLVHQGEPQLIPTLEAKNPMRLNFIIAFTNCSKTVDLDKNPYQCYLDTSLPSKSCSSYIWLETATRTIKYINVDCNSESARQKRSSLNTANATTDSTDIKDLVDAALAKLEMSSLHRYKQRVLHINSYSSKITTGKVTTIDFDVAYTSCIKYEWVKNVTDCEIIDHLPRRHCVAQIWERLWIHNGQHINVTCEDDETPLEAHIEFESAEMANQLAQQALKHIEAKYPHPQKQKIVRIFSLEKQLIAGIHYKMKVEVGFTHCLALSVQNNCTLNNDENINRFCRVNVWLRPWTDHPPNFRVSCDFQESVTSDLYHSIQAEHLFYDFITTYNPSYVNDHAEFARRFEIFKANIKKIHELNVHEKGTATYGVTRFADLTYKEFSSRYAGLNPKLRNNSQIPMKDADVPKINLPANFDWREFDAVTGVKDQGSCGSSWAFSVAGNIEGQWRMQSGELVSLSEQQLLDCDSVNKGCSGGLPENAYRTIEKQGGLETQVNYPYEGEVDKCLFNQTLAKAKISGSVNITSNETGMALWLVQNGPISIGINANAMQFYVNGISHPWDSYCDPGKLDHAALIVGYGVKEYHAFNKKITYWLVKNSWGTSWGEQGYYRVHRGTGTCGINRMATSAFIPSM